MKLFKAAMLGAVIASAIAPAAFAKGGKEFYSQDYQFEPADEGLRGHRRQLLLFVPAPAEPRVHDRPNGNERCKVQGWTLRQHCY